ncbi:MAG TPA: hypothetical protein VEB64_16555 [Azospirillaceae bacterium]|nr:hypothetical protein [Azospirillaceae bacterium]
MEDLGGSDSTIWGDQTMEGVGLISATAASYGAPDVHATAARPRVAVPGEASGVGGTAAAIGHGTDNESALKPASAERGKLGSDTLKDLILTTQRESPEPAFIGNLGQNLGESLSTVAPNSTVVATPGPEGLSTVMASVSTNLDGSGSSITFFTTGGGSATFNFGGEKAMGGLPRDLPFRPSVRAQAADQTRVDIAA